MAISGAILPTLANSDFALKDTDGSFLYVKRFNNDSKDNVYNIAVVNKHGEVEDYISSVHIKRNGNLRSKIKKDAELLLPQTRNTDGALSRNNSAPVAKVEENSDTAHNPPKKSTPAEERPTSARYRGAGPLRAEHQRNNELPRRGMARRPRERAQTSGSHRQGPWRAPSRIWRTSTGTPSPSVASTLPRWSR